LGECRLRLRQRWKSLERSSGKGSASRSQESLRVEKLEAKLREKNEVIAELLEQHVALKKD
jgi:hypothetical protein